MNAESAFEIKRTPSKEAQLAQENKAVRSLMGALTFKLKKKRREFCMRKTSQSVIERNKPLLKEIESLKSEHPF